jgi:hypothetical protein
MWLVYRAVFIFVAAFYAALIVPGINWDADNAENSNRPQPD